MRTAMRQMAGVFAELDRRLIIKRLRDGRLPQAAQGGKAVGRYPFGWSKDGEVPREQRVLIAVRDLRADGLRWQDVADRLNARSGCGPCCRGLSSGSLRCRSDAAPRRRAA